MRTHTSLRPAAAVSLLLAVVCLAALPASAQVVISQFYGGGGNSGATFKNDFIELYNAGGSAVSVAGWSVQYASSAGTTWQVTALTGTIQPGHYYLVQEAAGSGGTTALPTPDATGSINMSATTGKVALVNSTTALSGSCPSGTQDLLGFGTANCFEGAAVAPAPSNTTAIFRAGNGCTDTNNNSADFSAGAPNPRNSSSAASACGGPTNPTASGSASPAGVEPGDTVLLTVAVTPGANPPSSGIAVSADLTAIGGSANQTFYDDGINGGDAAGGDNVFSFQTIVSAPAGTVIIPVSASDAQSRAAVTSITLKVVASADFYAIHDIQGAGDVSPLNHQRVSTSGIVTLRKGNGFFLQAPDQAADADPNTSEGVFVFTSSAPPAAAAVGSELKVIATVSEFSPSSDPLSPPTTELSSIELVKTTATGQALPSPVTLSSAEVSASGAFDQLERFEGMRVHVDSLTVSGPTEGQVDEANATSSSFGTFDGILTGTPRPFREPGIEAPDPIPSSPCCIPRYDADPERLRVDSSFLPQRLEVATGAVVTNITGPLDYQFRTYMIDAEPGFGTAATGGMTVAPVRTPASTEFTVATMNLERLFDTVNDPLTSDAVLTAAALDKRLGKISLAIRDVLHLPDVIGVQEVENLSTLQALAERVNADAGAADPQYQAYLVEGNDIGGIDVGLLVKSSTVTAADVQQYGKDTHYINPATGLPYIVSGHEDVLNDRPPLVLSATVSASGQTLPFCVVVNHLRSLNGVDDPADDRVRQKRLQEAQFLAQLIQSLESSGAPQACGGNVVSVGDYNAYELNDGYVDVLGTILGTADANADMASGALIPGDLSDLVYTLPTNARYSYVFDGTAQVLDHILVNSPMLRRNTEFAYAHNNADFPESLRKDGTRSERYSDHDMGVGYFALPAPPPVLSLPGDMMVEATSAAGSVVTFAATADSNGTPTPVTCTPASGTQFPLGATTVSCSSSDARGNTATGSFTVTVRDTTPPVVSVTGVTEGAVYLLGNVPAAGCAATDAVSGVATQPSLAISGGNANGLGGFTATCSGAVDGAGNVAPPVSVAYSIGYSFSGLLPPFDGTAKAGSTLPLKWTLTDSTGRLIGAAASVASIQVATCANPAAAGNVSATGGTALRFDPSTGQFLFNWSTKGLAPGCYALQITFDDGVTHTALVNLW